MVDENELEVEVEVDDLSSALAEAWDDSEGTTDDTENQQHDTDTQTGTIDNSLGGSEKPAGGTEDAPVVQAGETPIGKEAEPDNAPPVGLSPGAREVWKDVPEVVQKEMRKREKDYEAGVMKYAQGAKRAEQMDHILQPFAQYMQMNGGPTQSINGLLQTASSLQMGSPVQRAQTVANLIKQFGVDIRTLDNMIVGQPAPAPDPVAQMVDQRLAPMQQMLGQYQQREQQEMRNVQQKAGEDLQSFSAANEFYNDVKADMADLMDLASNRQQNMTLDDAYSKAVAMHPQISQIISSRASQESATQKRHAASSISGSMGGPGGGGPPSAMRDALEDAWENYGRT
jgi:hypothetical protein